MAGDQNSIVVVPDDNSIFFKDQVNLHFEPLSLDRMSKYP